MTSLSRRSFLGGALAVSAAAVLPLPASADNIPILYGNGISDDTEGLRALLDGRPVICENELIVTSVNDFGGYLKGGHLMLSDEVRIPVGWRFENVHIEWVGDASHSQRCGVMARRDGTYSFYGRMAENDPA